MVRRYSNTAVETTISSALGSGDVATAVADSTGYPATPFIIVIEPDTANEEFILVGAKSGLTFSTLTRGFDGSVDGPHNAGSVVKHVAIASDFGEIWTHKHLDAEGSTPLDFGVPGNSFGGDVADEGTEETVSRSDHVHGRPSMSMSGGMAHVSVQAVQANYADGTPLAWSLETLDTDNYHDPITNNSRFTIPVDLGGFHLFLVHTNINMSSDYNKEAHLSIVKNGSVEILRSPASYTPDSVVTGITPLILMDIAHLLEGDYVQCYIYQNTGFARPVGTLGSHMSMTRLGA